jgi:hypothetical protein
MACKSCSTIVQSGEALHLWQNRKDIKSSGSCLENREYTAGGIRHADHVAPSIRTSWQSLRRQSAVARSVDIVRSRIQTMEFSFIFFCFSLSYVVRAGTAESV